MTILCATAFVSLAALPAPVALWAQAEPAPPSAIEPADPGSATNGGAAATPDDLKGDFVPPAPPFFAEVAFRLTQRPGADPGPKLGVGIGLTLGGRWAELWRLVELSIALDFAYAHHRADVQGVRLLPNGQEETFDGQRLSSENTFGALQRFSLLLPLVRPWVGVGTGLSLGYFSSDETVFRPGGARALRPYGHFAGGVALPLAGQTYLDLRVDYHAMTDNPEFKTAAGDSRRVFGDLFGIAVAFGSRLP